MKALDAKGNAKMDVMSGHYDLPIKAHPAAARDLYLQGVDLLLTNYPGALGAFDQAIAIDADFTVAHVARARALQIAGDMPAVTAAMQSADALLAGADAQTVSHAGVFRHLMAGRPEAGLDAVRVHLMAWPRDAVVLSTAANETGLIALSGRAGRKSELAAFLDGLAPAYGDDPWFAAHHGMALSENGQIERARPLVESSIVALRANSGGAHAMAHVLYESAEADAAITFLRGWLADYPRDGGFLGHLSWHLALVELARGDLAAGERLFDEAFAAADYRGPKFIKLLDATSFLWRAELAGYAHDAARWRSVHTFVHSVFPRAGTPFSDWHAAVADAAVGDSAALEQRLSELADLIQDGRYSAGETVLHFMRALQAFSQQNYAIAISEIEAMLPELVRMGGSRAQLDLVEATLLKACLAAGRLDYASRVLARHRPGAMPLTVIHN